MILFFLSAQDLLSDFPHLSFAEEMTVPPEQTRRGGPWRMDPENLCVWRGQYMRQLSPKAFAVLCYLVEHPGRVITKDELFEHLWSGTVVSDSALSVYMSALRKSLGDTARAPQFIETVHRRGYRFIGPAPLPPPSAADASGGALASSTLHGDHTEDEGQIPLLERYHELVDKQMLGSLSALERQELETLQMQLDEIDTNNQALQHAEAQMEARRKLVDEQLDKMSMQLQALLEQM